MMLFNQIPSSKKMESVVTDSFEKHHSMTGSSPEHIGFQDRFGRLTTYSSPQMPAGRSLNNPMR
jgi:hypothetical protein